MKRKISVLTFVLALCFGTLRADAVLFVSFIDVANAAAGNIQELSPFSPDNKCREVAITIVEDGVTNLADLPADQVRAKLQEAGLPTKGNFKFSLQDNTEKKAPGLINGANIKKGLDRDNNKGKKAVKLGFKVNKKGLAMKTASLCASDIDIGIGQDIGVSFGAANRKALKTFGFLTTVFSLPVANQE